MNLTMIITLIVGVLLGTVGGYFLKYFIDSPSDAKKQMILNYLVYAVALAEQAFGSKTGQLKLAKVYNEFVVEMPIIAKTISYDLFCSLVDQALEILKGMLKNKSIDEIINSYEEE